MNPTPPNNRLKVAVNSVPLPDDLEAHLRGLIRAESLRSGAPPRRRWLSKLVPAVAAVTVSAALLTAYKFGHFRLTRGSQDTYIASVSSHIGVLMRIGLRDHIHCSVFRKYPKNPLTVEEILRPTPERGVKAISPEYVGLVSIVRSQVPKKYRMTLAHQCTYKGREFIHLSLMDQSNMLSLVITRKVDGESFHGADMLPALSESGIPMYQAGVQRFQISAFETSDYLVYFISDLDEQRNADLMLAVAPRVKEFLRKLEL